MTIQEMKERKKELGYTNAQIAELTGVPFGTVQKIFSGATTSPRYDTLSALEQLLGTKRPLDSCISEAPLPYFTKRQGEYTLADYYQIPDEHRVELIDGVIYDMSAPTSAHQLISGTIHAKLYNHVMNNKGKCLPMISPLDVQLDCDDRTMVQPDVIIVCDRSKVIRRCIYGAPDFILEVLSPSTRRKDLTIKLNKYQNAGVREYWLVDPDKQKVMVYDLENNDFPAIYGFDCKVPVGIWNNECEIDFQELYDYIRFLYEE